MTATEMPLTVLPELRGTQADARSADLPVILAAGVALLTAAPVVEGKLQAVDVICLMALPFLPSPVWRYGAVRLLAVALAAWGVGQLVSDELNGLGPRISLQLGAALSILGIVPVLVFLARGNFRRIRYLVVGVSVGLTLELVVVERVSITDPASWKFGLNGIVTFGLLAVTDLSWRRGRRAPSVLALAAICLLGVVTDDRHLAAIGVLTAVLLMFRNRQRRPKTLSVVVGVTLLLAILGGAFIQAAQVGALGQRSGEQILQFGSSPQAILVNTRPEPFQEFYLFSLHPVFGWGSQPRLDSEAYLGSKQFLADLGVVRDEDELDNLWLNLEVPGVSAHSQAVDSWARAGVFAVPFWLLVLGLALRAGTRAVRFRSSPLLVLWTMLILWDAIFSPLTGLSHVGLAAFLALAITSLTSAAESGAGGD